MGGCGGEQGVVGRWMWGGEGEAPGQGLVSRCHMSQEELDPGGMLPAGCPTTEPLLPGEMAQPCPLSGSQESQGSALPTS